MNLIDKNQYTFSSELPGPCKILYDTVKNCELDMEFDLGVMDMKLSDAIRYFCYLYRDLLKSISVLVVIIQFISKGLDLILL